MSSETCKTCRYCRTAKTGLLECFRFPPKTFQLVRQNQLTQQAEQGFVSVYPQLNPSECPACGEYEEKYKLK